MRMIPFEHDTISLQQKTTGPEKSPIQSALQQYISLSVHFTTDVRRPFADYGRHKKKKGRTSTRQCTHTKSKTT